MKKEFKEQKEILFEPYTSLEDEMKEKNEINITFFVSSKEMKKFSDWLGKYPVKY